MTNRRLFLGSLLAGGFAALAPALAPALAQEGPPPYRPVPELRREEVPPPRRGFLWEPGHWRWDGREYFWVRGRWIEEGPRFRHFVHGHWERRGPAWFWVEPHWE
jgi:hypothetical protein